MYVGTDLLRPSNCAGLKDPDPCGPCIPEKFLNMLFITFGLNCPLAENPAVFIELFEVWEEKGPICDPV